MLHIKKLIIFIFIFYSCSSKKYAKEYRSNSNFERYVILNDTNKSCKYNIKDFNTSILPSFKNVKKIESYFLNKDKYKRKYRQYSAYLNGTDTIYIVALFNLKKVKDVNVFMKSGKFDNFICRGYFSEYKKVIASEKIITFTNDTTSIKEINNIFDLIKKRNSFTDY